MGSQIAYLILLLVRCMSEPYISKRFDPNMFLTCNQIVAIVTFTFACAESTLARSNE
jgi:hypothetical protein